MRNEAIGDRISSSRRNVIVGEVSFPGKSDLFFARGDMIPCDVTRIDQNGVSFATPLASSGSSRMTRSKAVELVVDSRGPVALTKIKRDAS